MYSEIKNAIKLDAARVAFVGALEDLANGKDLVNSTSAENVERIGEILRYLQAKLSFAKARFKTFKKCRAIQREYEQKRNEG